MTRTISVPLYVVVNANSSLGVATSSLLGAIQLDSIEMTWPASTSLNLIYRFFLVSQVPADLTQAPTSGEITGPWITPGKFAGESISKEYPFQKEIDPSTPYLVFYVTNNTGNTLSAEAAAIVSVLD